MLTAQQVADKWARNIGAAQESIKAGVQAVTEAPTAAAARSADLWQNRVSSQQAKEKYVRNLNRVTLEEWRQQMLGKGLQRISAGAQAARPKVESFMAAFLPYIEGIAQRVRQMPKMTLEDRIQRMIAQVRGASEFRRNG